MWKIYSLNVFQTHCSHETTVGRDTTLQGLNQFVFSNCWLLELVASKPSTCPFSYRLITTFACQTMHKKGKLTQVAEFRERKHRWHKERC